MNKTWFSEDLDYIQAHKRLPVSYELAEYSINQLLIHGYKINTITLANFYNTATTVAMILPLEFNFNFPRHVLSDTDLIYLRRNCS